MCYIIDVFIVRHVKVLNSSTKPMGHMLIHERFESTLVERCSVVVSRGILSSQMYRESPLSSTLGNGSCDAQYRSREVNG